MADWHDRIRARADAMTGAAREAQAVAYAGAGGVEIAPGEHVATSRALGGQRGDLSPPVARPPIKRDWWRRVQPVADGLVGVWTRVYDAPSQTCATSCAYYLRARLYAIPEGRYEFVSRTETGADGARTYGVYARLIAREEKGSGHGG